MKRKTHFRKFGRYRLQVTPVKNDAGENDGIVMVVMAHVGGKWLNIFGGWVCEAHGDLIWQQDPQVATITLGSLDQLTNITEALNTGYAMALSILRYSSN